VRWVPNAHVSDERERREFNAAKSYTDTLFILVGKSHQKKIGGEKKGIIHGMLHNYILVIIRK
jgi:hypothetical protein